MSGNSQSAKRLPEPRADRPHGEPTESPLARLMANMTSVNRHLSTERARPHLRLLRGGRSQQR